MELLRPGQRRGTRTHSLRLPKPALVQLSFTLMVAMCIHVAIEPEPRVELGSSGYEAAALPLSYSGLAGGRGIEPSPHHRRDRELRPPRPAMHNNPEATTSDRESLWRASRLNKARSEGRTSQAVEVSNPARVVLETSLSPAHRLWSGRHDSNVRNTAHETVALPAELLPVGWSTGLQPVPPGSRPGALSR